MVVAGLPDAIRAKAELSPVEDLLLAVLRDGLPGISVQSLIRHDQKFPFVLIRRDSSFGNWTGDTRFTDTARISVQALCEDPDGDADAAILAEVVRVVLRDAWLSPTVYPGIGHLVRVDMASAPRRSTDWATATGPVQYADLPTGVWRYETQYDIEIRKPLSR